MITKKFYWVFIALLFLISSCSKSSNSGGGSNGNGGTNPVTYTNADLQGTWQWNANRQTNPLNLTGTLSFNEDLRVIGWETDCCPGRQNFTYAQFWLWEDGYVKGRNPAFCDFPFTEVKFSMDFVPGTNKKAISGLMDIHQTDPATGIDSYERYDISLKK